MASRNAAPTGVLSDAAARGFPARTLGSFLLTIIAVIVDTRDVAGLTLRAFEGDCRMKTLIAGHVATEH
jgi:hypothetical protein